MSKKTATSKRPATKVVPKPAAKAPSLKVSPGVNLGTKRYCSHCHAKFYDFAKPEVVCPKCERVIDTKATHTYRRAPEPRKAAPPVKDPFDDEADVVIEDPVEADDDVDEEVTQGIDVDTDDE